MTGIFIFILFVLCLIQLFAIIILYVRQNRLIEIEKSIRQLKAESEEQITAFLAEIKEENERFLENLNKRYLGGETSKQIPSDVIKLERNEQQGKQKVSEDMEDKSILEASSYSKLRATKIYSLNQHNDPSMSDIELNKTSHSMSHSLQEKVKELKLKGLTIDDIAKQLQRGKTEIELLIKFQDNVD